MSLGFEFPEHILQTEQKFPPDRRSVGRGDYIFFERQPEHKCLLTRLEAEPEIIEFYRHF